MEVSKVHLKMTQLDHLVRIVIRDQPHRRHLARLGLQAEPRSADLLLLISLSIVQARGRLKISGKA